MRLSKLLNYIAVFIITTSYSFAQISCKESFLDNFDNNLSSWVNPTGLGTWTISNGILRGDYPITCGSTTCPQSELILIDEYQLSDNWKATVEFTEYEAYPGVNGYSAKFAFFVDPDNKMKIQIGEQSAGDQDSVLISLSHWDGSWQSYTLDGLSSTRRIEYPGSWNSTEINRASLVKEGTNYSLFLNNNLLITIEDIYLNGDGDIGLGTYGGVETSSFLLESCSKANDFRISGNSYTETSNLDSLSQVYFGDSAEIADWNDLVVYIQSFDSIEDFYETVGIEDNDVAYIKLNGERFVENSNRHFYLQRFDDKPYEGFLVHEQYQSLYLGSWFGLDMNFISMRNSNDNPFRKSSNTYSETLNLDSLSTSIFGESAGIADWSDIKDYIIESGSITEFYYQIGLKNQETALVTFNDQQFFNGGDRHFYLQRFDDGPYSGFLVHDQIENLYLGSWFGLDMNFLINHGDEGGGANNYSVLIEDVLEIENLNSKSSLVTKISGISDKISAYQFDLEIPKGLTFTGLDTASTLSSGGIFQTNLIGNTLKVAFSTTDYFKGDSLLLKLEFEADGSGDYEIAPFNFVLNNMDIDSVTPGILSVVELLGDVDDNDSIQAFDGALALQYSVGIDPITSIDALPWDIWRVAAADVDQDNQVLALDASYILQKTVDLIDEFPNANLKSLPIELLVQQDGKDLVFSTFSEGLIGFNTSIPTSETLTFSEPTYSWEESIHAINQKEESLEIGIASHIPASGEFLRIPFEISEEKTFELEVIKNNITQLIEITLSNTSVNTELISEGVKKFNLTQNYPNPFNPSTQISYSLPQAVKVRLEVLNMLGQRVATLVNERKTAGNYTVNFDASGLSSGVYFYTIQAGAFTQTNKMLLIK